MKLLLIGKNGQVGFELEKSLKTIDVINPVDAIGRQECDLSEIDSLKSIINASKPKIIVNAAAYTNVELAEQEVELAYKLNRDVPCAIGEMAQKSGALIVHYSTDYVFDGSKSGFYSEDDRANPINIYGKSKLAGENALISSGAKCLIFRTSWVYGVHGNNFLKTILKLSSIKESIDVINNQYGSPTTSKLIAETTAKVLKVYIERKKEFTYGIYNLVSSGVTSWHDYARRILFEARMINDSIKLKPDSVIPISSHEFPSVAKRPANSALDNSKLRDNFGLVMPNWEVGIKETLEQLL